jgi:hypothetical protein
MKTKAFVVVCLALCLTLVAPPPLAAQGAVFVVEPSGGDDTDALQAAFDAALAAGPGSVVELAEGDFNIHEPIVVYNWSGTVRGAGKDRTILHTNADPFPRRPLPEDAYGPWSTAGMFMFMYDDGAVGELRVEGMTFLPTGLSTEDPTQGNVDITPIFIGTGVLGSQAHVDSILRDLRLRGDRSDSYPAGMNMGFGIVFLRVPGTHIISGCDFEDSFAIGFVTVLFGGGKLIVGGPRPSDRVTFTNMGFTGMFGFSHTNLGIDISNVQASNIDGPVFAMYALSNSRVHMWDVETVDAAGAMTGPCFLLGCAEEPSSFLFEHNTIRMKPGMNWAGFEMHQWSEVKSDIAIRNNRIHGDGSLMWGNIFTSGARNAVITNNKISGSGMAAMYLGAWGADDSGHTVVGNNVQDWQPDGSVCGPDCEGMPLAPIWLGSETSDILVVGSGNLRTAVFDETDNPDTPEYDGRNILVGISSQGMHVGQLIREAMQQRLAVKQAMMLAGGY